jgi:hypothetical protein
MYSKAIAGAVLALGVTVSAASAGTVTINSITGVWQNTDPSSGITFVNPSEIRWGTPATSSGKSGYRFDAAGTPIEPDEGVDFSLGEFTHFNRPITGTSLDSVDLLVTIGFDIDGIVQTPVESLFSFTHDETPNSPLLKDCKYPGSVTRCDDLVTATLNLGATESFFLDGTEYVFTISGFEVGGSTFTSFLTRENDDNTATLKARYVTKESVEVIPLPAAGWLLLGGVAGLAAMRRKKAA